jgi:hypothetical protein
VTWQAPGAAPCPAASTARLKYSGIVNPGEHSAILVQQRCEPHSNGVAPCVQQPWRGTLTSLYRVCALAAERHDELGTCDPRDGQEAEDSRQPRQRPSLRQADAEAVQQHGQESLGSRRRRQRPRRRKHRALMLQDGVAGRMLPLLLPLLSVLLLLLLNVVV